MTTDFASDIKAAVDTLKQGGIILYPTDTIWGIGCDATNPEAVARIYELKRRADSKSMILLVDSVAALERTVGELPEAAEQLIDVAVNPLTIVYPQAQGVAGNVKAEDGSVGIRISAEPYSRELCRRLHRPVVSTSANISGERSPRFFDEIAPEIIAGVDYVAQYRRDDRQPHSPSNIIKIASDNSLTIIR